MRRSDADSARAAIVEYRATPEDFRVVEIPLYPASGVGEHTFVLVEKRDRTTEQVAAELAARAGCAARDVGYAGRKDRWAIARQWFSVPRLAPAEALRVRLNDAVVLLARRHGNKLRTGHLSANRFVIVLQGRGEVDWRGARRRLAGFSRHGFANRFGSQRFGRHGDNARQGLQILRGERRPRNRRTSRFLLSALQAEVFNRVAERRLELLRTSGDVLTERPYSRLLLGDIAVIHRTGGQFLVRDPLAEQGRADRFEISPTGPIFGSRVLAPGGDVLELERAVLDELGIDPERRVPGIRLAGARRPLRMRPEWASLTDAAGGAVLQATLPPGTFASVLIEELFPADLVRQAERGAGRSGGAVDRGIVVEPGTPDIRGDENLKEEEP